MYLKIEFDISTLALVAGMTNNIFKTLITLGNISPIYFSLMTEMVWDRDFGFLFLFAQYRFHSFNSCLYCNILIQALHSSALHYSKLLGMILIALIEEETLP